MEGGNRPLCKFGDKCYRKNPKHFEIYCHSKESNVKENRFRRYDKQTAESGCQDKTVSFSSARMKESVFQCLEKNHLSTSKLQACACKKRNNAAPNVKEKDESKLLNDGKESYNKKVPINSKVSRNLTMKKMTVSNNKVRTAKTPSCFKTHIRDDDDVDDCFASNEENNDNCQPVQNASWILVKNESKETKISSDFIDLKNKTKNEVIKILFFVDMPPDFYSFYEFCKSVNGNHDLKGFRLGKLKLVGPFDILSGEINYSVNQKLFLCHWRFYYDPPEFQTVLATEYGFHIGYWRDSPKENPVFLASNNPNKDCIFKIEAENIFGTVQ